MKRLLLPVLGVALACGGFAVGFSWRDAEIAGVRQQADIAASEAGKRLESLEASLADLTKERDDARGQREKLDVEIKDLAKKLAESEETVAKSTAALARATAQAKNQAASGASGNPMKAMAEMFKTPEMKDAVVQQNLGQLDLVYGKLYDRLQLEGLDRQDFKNLLGERMRAELEMGVRLMGGDVSSQQTAAAAEELKKANAASDQKIRAFLNNEIDYQTFQKWEQSRPERMLLNMGAAAFAGAGDPLTPAQEDQLVSAMSSARTQSVSVPDMTKPENLSAANLSPQMVEKFLASYDTQASRVAAGAAAYLSPVQMEALKTFQKQQRAMQEMGLKMGAAMMGGK
jgi:hypothetical protein